MTKFLLRDTDTDTLFTIEGTSPLDATGMVPPAIYEVSQLSDPATTLLELELPPVLSVPPSITTTGKVGTTATLVPGTWTGATGLTYRWQYLDGSTWTDLLDAGLSPETGTSITLDESRNGLTIRVQERADNSDGFAYAYSETEAIVYNVPVNGAAGSWTESETPDGDLTFDLRTLFTVTGDADLSGVTFTITGGAAAWLSIDLDGHYLRIDTIAAGVRTNYTITITATNTGGSDTNTINLNVVAEYDILDSDAANIAVSMIFTNPLYGAAYQEATGAAATTPADDNAEVVGTVKDSIRGKYWVAGNATDRRPPLVKGATTYLDFIQPDNMHSGTTTGTPDNVDLSGGNSCFVVGAMTYKSPPAGANRMYFEHTVSANANAGGWNMIWNDATQLMEVALRDNVGLGGFSYSTAQGFPAPDVPFVFSLQFNTAGAAIGEEVKLRINGVQLTGTQSGRTALNTTALANAPLYICSRNAASVLGSMTLYGLVVRRGIPSVSQIQAYENLFSQLTGSASLPVISDAGIVAASTVGDVATVSGFSQSGSGVTLTYQWTRNGVDIAGAPGASYLTRAADKGTNLARRTRSTNSAGFVEATTPAVAIAPYALGVTLTPFEKSSNVAINGTNAAQARTTNNATGTVRAERYVLTGKWYCEVVVPGGSVFDLTAWVGLTQFDGNLSPASGNVLNNDLTAVHLNGGITGPTGFFGNNLALTADRAGGDTIRMAWDMATRRVYFGTKAGWDGDPVAGTGGSAMPNSNYRRLTVSIMPRTTSTTQYMTLRSLASTFGFTPPTGYLPYAEASAQEQSAGAPRAADAFAESIGVCCKFDRGGVDAYRQLIIDLGVRYIRSMMTAATTPLAHAKYLYDNHGIRFNVRLVKNGGAAVSSDYDLPQTTTFYNAAIDPAKLGIPAIISFEGPNEPNREEAPDVGWDTRANEAQLHVYNLTNNNPNTAHIPVLGIPTWMRSIQAQTMLGNQADKADEVGLHHYMDGSRPTYAHRSVTLLSNPKINLDLDVMMADIASVHPPGCAINVSETGVRAIRPGELPTNFNPTEELAGNYIIRLLFDFYRYGTKRTYIYSMIEEIEVNEEPWGLLSQQPGDILRKRPAYLAVQRVIGVFNDPGTPTLTELFFVLSGNLSDVHYLMFRKVSGIYLLAIWQDVETWNRSTAAEDPFPNRDIRLTLGQTATLVRRRLPTTTATITTVGTNTRDIMLSVPDEVCVYEITL